MSSKTKEVSTIGIGAIMSLFAVSMGFSVLTPATSALAEHFVGKDVTWFSTIPTLFIVFGTFLGGQCMGKRFTCRTMAIMGSLAALIFGCAPALFDSYAGTLICRAGFGLGMGFMFPLGNSLIIGTFSGSRQASLLGYGTLFMNGGGIVTQMLGGILAGRYWQLTFWGHLFFVLSLVMAFFLPELPKEEKTSAVAVKTGTKEKPAKMVYVIGLVLLIFNMMNYAAMVNLALLLEARNAGGAEMAATGLSIYTVLGCVGGFIFGNVFRKYSRRILTIGFAFCGLGTLVMFAGQTFAVISGGLAMIGFGFAFVYPSLMSWIGIVTPASTVAVATSILLAMQNFGAFLTSVYLKVLQAAFGNIIYSALLTETVVCLIIAGIFFFYNPFKKNGER